jgi:hypothetical protein
VGRIMGFDSYSLRLLWEIISLNRSLYSVYSLTRQSLRQ